MVETVSTRQSERNVTKEMFDIFTMGNRIRAEVRDQIGTK